MSVVRAYPLAPAGRAAGNLEETPFDQRPTVRAPASGESCAVEAADDSVQSGYYLLKPPSLPRIRVIREEMSEEASRNDPRRE